MQLEATFGTVKWISILKLRSRCSQHCIWSKTQSHYKRDSHISWFGLTNTAVYILLVLWLVLRTVRPRQYGRCHEPESKQRDPLKLTCVPRNRDGRLRLKCDGTHAETRFRLSAKRTSPFKSAGGRQFSRLLAAEVCASAVVMPDTPCSEVVWRVLATHSIRQFPLHFPSSASPCAVTFQLDSTSKSGWSRRIAVCIFHITAGAVCTQRASPARAVWTYLTKKGTENLPTVAVVPAAVAAKTKSKQQFIQ